MSRSRAVQAVLLASLAVLVTACGGGPDGAGGTSQAAGAPASGIPDTAAIVQGVQKDAQLNAALPATVKQAGVLHLASNVQSPPNNFYAADGTTVIGYDHDLITAIGNKLGLEVEYQDRTSAR